jgi:hypothetical protein
MPRKSKQSLAIAFGEAVAQSHWEMFQEHPEFFPKGLASLPDLCGRIAKVSLWSEWVFPNRSLDKGPEPEWEALAAWTAHQKFQELAGMLERHKQEKQMTKYVYTVTTDTFEEEPRVLVFSSNKKVFEETGYASDQDYFPEGVDLGFELEEQEEGIFLVTDKTLTVAEVKARLIKCPLFEESASFEAFIMCKEYDDFHLDSNAKLR